MKKFVPITITHPHLVLEWHPMKNGSLTPNQVSFGSHKKVWWKCDKGYDHEWLALIKDRSRGKGCPCCSGKKIVLSNCLATLNPIISNEWHPTKNVNLTPFEVTVFSNRKVWWKCNKDEDHEWKSAVSDRSVGKGCPYCANKKVCHSNCLLTLNPQLASQWHPTKNGNTTPMDVTPGSHKKVRWLCKNGIDHEWESTVYDRTDGQGCPVCAGQKVVPSNCFATLQPKLALEWHPYKNKTLTPFNVTQFSNRKVWWICRCGCEWKTTIRHRAYGNGCLMCCEKSKAEKIIKEFLHTNNYEFVYQKRFEKCKNKRKLPFDFYLPKYNLCIEYNGIQHYKPRAFFGGIAGFNATVKNDKIKREFCLKNNIRLMVIKYDEQLEDKLRKELSDVLNITNNDFLKLSSVQF